MVHLLSIFIFIIISDFPSNFRPLGAHASYGTKIQKEGRQKCELLEPMPEFDNQKLPKQKNSSKTPVEMVKHPFQIVLFEQVHLL